MSSDFEKVLILDDRLCCTDKIKFGVGKSGQNVTVQPYAAISQNPSSIVFNLQVPSEATVLDRKFLWRSTITLKFVFNTNANNQVPAGVYPIQLGTKDALAPFPLHQLCTVQSVTINNNTVSINTRDVLSAILRMNDKREMMRYNGLCPTAYDTYGRYSDAVGAISNPNGAYTNFGDNDLLPRGAFAVDSIYQIDPATNAQIPQAQSSGALDSQTVYVRFTSTEPLLLSPFIFCMPETSNQGMYGIVNINAVFNLGTANRVFRSASPWFANNGAVAGASVSVDSITNTQLLVNQLTPHPSTLLPSRNCVSYYTLPRFITTFTADNFTTASNALVNVGGVNSLNQLNQGVQLTSTNLQLNMIPDRVIIFCRKAMGTQTPNDPDAFLAIRGISINFNNQSGILSTASVSSLYQMSVEAGSNQSYQEFLGVANVGSSNNSTTSLIPTTGSVLVLEFGRHIQIQDDYYSQNSLGNFQFQFNLNVVNQFGPDYVANGVELVLITMNSGVFCLERGTSSSFQGILTRSDVLDASTQEPYSHSEVKRLVGGGMEDTLKSVMGNLKGKMHGSAKKDVLGSLGYGMSAGGMSAGGMSGGSKHKLSSKFL